MISSNYSLSYPVLHSILLHISVNSSQPIAIAMIFRRFEDQARTTLEGDVFEQPLNGHQQAGRAADQEIDVAQPPNPPGQPALGIEMVEIGDCSSPADGGHHTEIAVLECFPGKRA